MRDSWSAPKGEYMKTADNSGDMRPRYDRVVLGKGVRGKHLAAYRDGTNLVLLSPDVAKVFATDEAVNEALRSLIDLAKKSARGAIRGKRARAG